MLGWLSSKRQKIRSAGEDVEKLESSYTASRNIKWCSLFGKQANSSLRLKKSYHVVQQFHL